jgi:hypothetical protein
MTLRSVLWGVGLALLAVSCLISRGAPAEGSMIETLSEASSDSTPAERLNATLAFDVIGDVLRLTATNLTQEPLDYYINQIFFNATPNVTGLTLTEPSGWSLRFDEDGNRASPFGEFDVGLFGGVGNSPYEVAPGESLIFTMLICGSGPFADSDFVSETSYVWGGQLPSLAAAKFIRGPGDDSARGNAAPEPATLGCVGVGLVGLWLASAGRRRMPGPGADGSSRALVQTCAHGARTAAHTAMASLLAAALLVGGWLIVGTTAAAGGAILSLSDPSSSSATAAHDLDAPDPAADFSYSWSDPPPALVAAPLPSAPTGGSAEINVVPEPVTVSLVGAGMIAVWMMSRCRGRGAVSNRAV